MLTTLKRIACGLALLGATAAHAQAPDFDAVAWTPIGCPAADLTADTSPSAVNFAGDATYPAAYYAHDANYLYFRYRMDGDPSGPGGLAQYTWTALMQVPSGDPFQYQYQLSLEGGGENIEIWANTDAHDIDFSPLFHDDSEALLLSVPRGALARSLPAGDGSSFGNGPDYFVDFAFPVSDLVAQGVVADTSALASSFFFPATSTNGNNYNKGHLNCSFLPTTELAIDKTVGPATLLANTTTPLVYTIAVMNEGPGAARGVVVDDIALPTWMSNVIPTVASDDPTVMWTVESTNPLHVRVDLLPPGATLSVQLAADAAPDCSVLDFMNVATTQATNAIDDAAVALVSVQHGDGEELCDGADNDCDGQTDEGTDVVCDDGDACTGAETCGGQAGCLPGTPPTCDDQNACTVDACDPQAGCVNTPTPGCVPCATDADCDDQNACSADACTDGICGATPIPGCVPCATDADCTDDGNACTDETCMNGACAAPPIAGCEPCQIDADCDDQNACSTDACAAGVCHHTPQPGCVPCATDADCDDQNACSTDACTAGVCGATPMPGCVSCTTAADCADADVCTDDLCTAGVCGHASVPGCVPCTSDADCDDTDACTTDTCTPDGSCGFTGVAGCVPCATDADCDDQDTCTTDTCGAGTCGHADVPDCLVPLPEAEVCGNCLDDDGDGLADYEDSDCCAVPLELGLQKGMLKARKRGGTKFRLKARYADVASTSFDPMTQDTTLQISDASGQLFCQTVAAPRWKHPRKRVFKFKDKKGLFAGGLKRGVFKLRKDGSIAFRTRGKKMALRAPDGTPLTVTVRVGGQCASSTASLRQKRRVLVFP